MDFKKALFTFVTSLSLNATIFAAISVDLARETHNSIGPTGAAGTDVPLGAAGIGGAKEVQEINKSIEALQEKSIKDLLHNGIIDSSISNDYTPEILPAEERLMRELEADRQHLTNRNINLAPIP